MERLFRLVFVLLIPSAMAHAAGDMEEWRKSDSTPTKAIQANTDVKEESRDEVNLVQKRLEHYKKRGMDYAISLIARQDGSREDEIRQKKSDSLGYRLRFNTIEKTKTLLGKTRDPRIAATLLKRLSDLYEKQANSEQILYAGTSKGKLYVTSLNKAIEIRNDLLRKYRPYITPDIVVFSLAENYMMLEDLKRAEANYLEVVKFPKSIFIADAYLALGNLRYQQKNFGGARGFYSKILDIKGTPLSAYAHYKIAWAYFNEGNENAANNALIDAIKTSRAMAKSERKKLDVEEEAVRDLVLFYSESGDPSRAKSFFEGIVGKEDAKDMRYMLARRYFSHDKHKEAFMVASDLLNDNPPDNSAGQLLMITLSISEKTKQRNSSLTSARRLSDWVLAMQKKLSSVPKDPKGQKEFFKEPGLKSDYEELEMIMTDAEESLRRLSHRLHYDAQKWSQSELWTLGKESYEIYFRTYNDTKELPEMRFRYAALLFRMKLRVDTYNNINTFLAMVKQDHPRFQEAMKLRIQTIEEATKSEREKLDDKKLIAAYDDYAKYYPKDNLAVEALFKAANLAKVQEGPEKAAERFRYVAQTYPQHKLRDAAVKESLATLLAAQKWSSLANESKLLISIVSQAEESKAGGKGEAGKAEEDKFAANEVYRQLLNARNTALVKIAEDFEAQQKYKEAQKAYLDFIGSRKNSTLRPMALIKLATLNENKLQDYAEAIKVWHQIGEEYATTKEGQVADLEEARIYEKILQPKNAVSNYVAFSQKGKAKIHRSALTNSAVILESIGEWDLAADQFLKLSKVIREDKGADKEAFQAAEFSCRNRLLAAAKPKDESVYGKLAECAGFLGRTVGGVEGTMWKIRSAWAMEKSGRADDAVAIWQQVADAKKQLTSKDEYSVFFAMAKTRLIVPELNRFRAISFEKTNERPDANIAKKTQALDRVEQIANEIMKFGTDGQIELAKRVMFSAYNNFGESLEKATFPKALADADKEALKKGFVEAAGQMRTKAQEYAPQVQVAKNESKASRGPASVSSRSYPSLSNSEFREWIAKAAAEGTPEAYARLAWHMYDKGEIGTARYVATKWEAALKKHSSSGEFGEGAYQEFWTSIGQRMAMVDPLLAELQESSSVHAKVE